MKKTLALSVVVEFANFISYSKTGKRLPPSGKRISKGTITGYIYALKLLQEYELAKKEKLRILLLHKASQNLLKKEKKYWHVFFTQFTNFLYRDKKYYDRYVLTVIKIVKTFFNYIQNEKGLVIGNFHKSFRIPLIQFTPVVLSPEQLHFLITDKGFENSLPPSLKRVKDILVIGCTVGLRVSDLMALKKANIVVVNNHMFLRVHTQKTGIEVQVPIPDYAQEIIKRYDRKYGQYLLPRLQNTNINLHIKKLIQKAGWDYAVPKYRSLRGRMVEITGKSANSLPFYAQVTSHTMRRTDITTLLILGVPENVVRKLSGHAPGSNEFYRYVVIAQDYLNQEIIKAQQKLMELPN
jgi:integrase